MSEETKLLSKQSWEKLLTVEFPKLALDTDYGPAVAEKAIQFGKYLENLGVTINKDYDVLVSYNFGDVRLGVDIVDVIIFFVQPSSRSLMLKKYRDMRFTLATLRHFHGFMKFMNVMDMLPCACAHFVKSE